MRSLTRYVEEELKLKVNPEKSAVARPWKRSFLGFTFRKIWGKMIICVADKSWKRFRTQVKALFRPGRGQNMGRFIRETLNPVLRGWIQYFRLGQANRRSTATTSGYDGICAVWSGGSGNDRQPGSTA
jgi:RNA-directed DNA polymerase